MKESKKIKVTKNGPYLVPEGIPIQVEHPIIDNEGNPEKWQKINDIPTKGVVSLCRCGRSKNKPFCDNSHIKTNFDGTETAIEKDFKTALYEGKKFILKDTEELCSFARFCDRGGQIWNLIQKSDNNSNQMAKEEEENCPSGRLVLIDKETKEVIEPKFGKSISVTHDNQLSVGGPLWIKGGIEIESADGKSYEIRNRVCLCRCGKSDIKPFCDGTHART